MENARTAVLTIAVGAVGGLSFYLLSAPAAFLTGAAAAVTVATAFFHMPAHLPAPVRNATFAVLGAMMGAGITPEALGELARLPLALVGLLVVIVGATFASYVVLRQIGGWDKVSSLIGSIPGHFSLVMIVAMEQDARMERVLMAQALRLFLLVTLIPFVLGGSEASGLRSAGPPAATLLDVALTLAVAAAAAVVAIRLRLPAPALLGPMLASTALNGLGWMTIAVPPWIAATAFVLLGASVGSRFGSIRPEGLARMLVAAAGSFVVAVAVAIALSVAVAALLDKPLGEVFLAYAPGGLDAMIALTYLLGLDVAFVAILHTARMIVLAFAIPLCVPWFVRWVGPEGMRDAHPRAAE